ncbi:hypothetical protein PEC18_30805 [Paucibacter sp. O1-1]|nr:hypothetical protein [Paucibacter sp. O1-1]MDA3830098.1 hypothetical protein [Paucibacter sp. O1-1]
MHIFELLERELAMEAADHPAGQRHVVVPVRQLAGTLAHRRLPGHVDQLAGHGVAGAVIARNNGERVFHVRRSPALVRRARVEGGEGAAGVQVAGT